MAIVTPEVIYLINVGGRRLAKEGRKVEKTRKKINEIGGKSGGKSV